jgi:hypothetical protein
MIRKLTTSLLFAGLAYGAFAQDSATVAVEEANPLNITGFVDAYYKYDFGKDASNNRTSFTPAYNNFALGMASVKFDKTLGKVGFVADLGFGPRAKEFSYNDDGVTAAIKQLYVSYAPSEKFKFTLGSWATHVGYELVDAPGNRNYSMSYMFSYGPFFHTGLKAEYFFGTSSIMLGIANPTTIPVLLANGITRLPSKLHPKVLLITGLPAMVLNIFMVSWLVKHRNGSHTWLETRPW